MIAELSVIIPTLNEARYLPRLLDSLQQQTYDGKLEIIVVDGQSADKTMQIARAFTGQFAEFEVVSTQANVGHQRNFGAARAKYDYLLFLDADVILPPGLIAGVIRRVDERRAFLVSVNHTAAKVTVIDRIFLVIGFAFVTLAQWAGFPPAIGDFMMTTRAQHRKIGGFVEGALLGEDSDYGIRCVKAGARYYFFWRLSVIASDRRVRLMGRTKLLVVWIRGYLHVMRRGPVFPGEGYEYPFGHYDQAEREAVAKRSHLR